jgi:hypothetical protein
MERKSSTTHRITYSIGGSDEMKTGLKVFILTYLSVLFFGSFFAAGAVYTGVFEKALPFILNIKTFLYYFLQEPLVVL